MQPLALFYVIPLFIFVFLAVYTIYELTKAKRQFLSQGPLFDSFGLLVMASIFLGMWGIEHIFHDLFPMQPDLGDFFHYVVSHGFLLAAMISITVAAKRTQKFVYLTFEKGKLKLNELKEDSR